VTWLKVDDHLDDDARFIGISDGAAGLFLMTLSRCGRRDDPFIPLSAVEARRSEPGDVDALLARNIWIAATGGYAIEDALWEEISLPPERQSSSAQHAAAGRASAEARRARYGTAKPGATGNDVHERAPNDVPNALEQRSRNGRTPTPEPVPVNAESPLRSTQRAATAARTITVHQNGNGTLVGAYVDACATLGLIPDRRRLPQIGAEAKRLQQEGHAESVLIAALGELARRNMTASNLGYIVGDLERARAGVDTSRRAPPSVNPIDARVAAMRSPSTVIEVPKRD